MAKIYKEIQELGEIITGKTPSTADETYWGGEIPFITPTDINGFTTYYQESTERYVSSIGAARQKKTLLPPNTVCVTCIGSTIGKPCITKVTSITNQQINGIIANEDNDYRYLYYLMRYNLPYMQMIAGGSGSGTPIISKNKFAKFKFLVEDDLRIQRAIAKRLSAYDNLIENNTKRIAILERMAEQIYREWVVRKRGIGKADGWHKGYLGDICCLKRGRNITSSEMKPGIIPVIAAGLEPSGYHDAANVHGVSITMSSSGANAGFIGIHYSDIWAADCAYASECDTPNIYYAYEVMNNLRPVIDNFKIGAAQPHVYPKHINAIKIEIPPKSLMAEANNRLSPIHCMIANLQRQNALLARERDSLLPRLMSGRIEVKHV